MKPSEIKNEMTPTGTSPDQKFDNQTSLTPSLISQPSSQEASWQAQDAGLQKTKKRKARLGKIAGATSSLVAFVYMFTLNGSNTQPTVLTMTGAIIFVVGLAAFAIWGIYELRRQRRITSLSQPLSPSSALLSNMPSGQSVDFSAMRVQPSKLRKSPLAIVIWMFGIIGLCCANIGLNSIDTSAGNVMFTIGCVLAGLFLVLMFRRSPIMFDGTHESGLSTFAASNNFVFKPGIDSRYHADIGAILGFDTTNGWNNLESTQLTGVSMRVPFSVVEVRWLVNNRRLYNGAALVILPTLQGFYDETIRKQFEARVHSTGICSDIDYRTGYTYCRLMMDYMPNDLGTMQRTFDIIEAAASVPKVN